METAHGKRVTRLSDHAFIKSPCQWSLFFHFFFGVLDTLIPYKKKSFWGDLNDISVKTATPVLVRGNCNEYWVSLRSDESRHFENVELSHHSFLRIAWNFFLLLLQCDTLYIHTMAITQPCRPLPVCSLQYRSAANHLVPLILNHQGFISFVRAVRKKWRKTAINGCVLLSSKYWKKNRDKFCLTCSPSQSWQHLSKPIECPSIFFSDLMFRNNDNNCLTVSHVQAVWCAVLLF